MGFRFRSALLERVIKNEKNTADRVLWPAAGRPRWGPVGPPPGPPCWPPAPPGRCPRSTS